MHFDSEYIYVFKGLLWHIILQTHKKILLYSLSITWCVSKRLDLELKEIHFNQITYPLFEEC